MAGAAAAGGPSLSTEAGDGDGDGDGEDRAVDSMGARRESEIRWGWSEWFLEEQESHSSSLSIPISVFPFFGLTFLDKKKIRWTPPLSDTSVAPSPSAGLRDGKRTAAMDFDISPHLFFF